MHLSLTRFCRLAFLGALALAPSARSQANVLVVDSAGGGAFTQIASAIAAASDGDVVLVKAGTYGGFSIGDRALDVVADSGALVVVQGAVAVLDVAATRTVTLTGLDIRADAGTNGLSITNCAGSVRVQGCSARSAAYADCGPTPWGAGHGARVLNSLDVAFARCTLRGADGNQSPQFSHPGGSGIEIHGSRVALHDSTSTGGRGGDFFDACVPHYGYGYGGDGGSGLRTTNSSLVFVSRGGLQGGRGGDLGYPSPSHGDEGCAGAGWLTNAAWPGAWMRVLDSALTPGGNGLPQSGGYCGLPQAVSGTAPVALGGTARVFTASRVTRENGSLRLDFSGQPGDRVELVFGERGRLVAQDALRGTSLIRASKPQPVMQVGVVPASGTLTLLVPIGELGAGVAARRSFAQALFVEPGGAATLSASATIVLLDSSY